MQSLSSDCKAAVQLCLPQDTLGLMATAAQQSNLVWLHLELINFQIVGCVAGTGIRFYMLTLVQNFYIPFIRDFVLAHGMCDCARATCLHLLTRCLPFTDP